MGHIPRNEIWQSHFKQGHSFTLMQLLGLEPFWGFRWQFPDCSQWLLLLSMPKYPDLLFWHSNSNWDETSSFSPWLPYLSVVFGFVGALLVAQTVKNLPAMQETQVQSLNRENPLEKGMTTHSSILAWRIPWRSMGSQRVRHNWATNIHTHTLFCE